MFMLIIDKNNAIWMSKGIIYMSDLGKISRFQAWMLQLCKTGRSSYIMDRLTISGKARRPTN